MINLIALLLCVSVAHPNIIIEENADTLYKNEFNGINYYIPKWYATTAELNLYHSYNWQLANVYHLDRETVINDFIYRSVYNMIILDEPTIDDIPYLNAGIVAVRKINPDVKIAVVEPVYDLLLQYLQNGGIIDYVAGEDYNNWNNITVQQLNSLKDTYGVKTQMWTVGTDKVFQYENAVDSVVAVDIHGTWGTSRVVDYSNSLRIALNQTCKMYLPVVNGELLERSNRAVR